MKRPFPLLLALVALFAASFANAQPVPVIDRAVNDYAHVLTPPEAERLTGEIEALAHVTGIQVALVTVYTTAGYPVDDYALATARQWRGGVDGRRAIVALFATNDHHSNLQVGSGLEEQVPDDRAAEILLALRPALRERRYADAFSQMVGALRSSLATAQTSPGAPAHDLVQNAGRHEDDNTEGLVGVVGLAILGSPFIVFPLAGLWASRKRKREREKMDAIMRERRYAAWLTPPPSPARVSAPRSPTPPPSPPSPPAPPVVKNPAPTTAPVSAARAAEPPTMPRTQKYPFAVLPPSPSVTEVRKGNSKDGEQAARQRAEDIRRRNDEDRAREQQRRRDDEERDRRRRDDESSSWSAFSSSSRSDDSSSSYGSSSSSSSSSDWSSSGSSDSGSGGFDGGGSSGDW